MRHAIRYEGGFERNFSALTPGTTDFVGDDGQRHQMADWPADIAGLRFAFMERPGKHFVAVRVQFDATDIVLPHDVPIDTLRHLGGRHLGPAPLVPGDEPAGALLGDIIDANRERFEELSAMRDQIRQAIGPRARSGAGSAEPRP
jgi:hypothetical protein